MGWDRKGAGWDGPSRPGGPGVAARDFFHFWLKSCILVRLGHSLTPTSNTEGSAEPLNPRLRPHCQECHTRGLG